MSGLETRPTFGPTSAAGAMVLREAREPVLVGRLLAGLGTSTTYALPRRAPSRLPTTMAHTTAGGALVATAPPSEVGPSHATPGAAIGELRRLSGFTWEQLARVFDVSRRSLHFWASGKPMASSNEEHLHNLLAVMRKIDRGSASANRAALLSAREDGSIPFDLLVGGRYERVVSLLGHGQTRPAGPSPLSEQARAARAPRPPDELVDALHDRIHATSGRLLAAKSMPVPRTE